jgi:hypothetical protein
MTNRQRDPTVRTIRVHAQLGHKSGICCLSKSAACQLMARLPPGSSSDLAPRPDLSGLIHSLTTAQHVLEIYRRNVTGPSARRLLDRLANRIVKILSQTRKLNPS